MTSTSNQLPAITHPNRPLKLMVRGAVAGLCLGALTGSLLAGLGELLYGAVPALPYFVFGAIFGGVIGAACGFLSAVLALVAEHAASRWPKAARTVLIAAAAFTGVMAPFLGFFGPDLFDLASTWVLWAGGLAAAPLALWMLHRHPGQQPEPVAMEPESG